MKTLKLQNFKIQQKMDPQIWIWIFFKTKQMMLRIYVSYGLFLVSRPKDGWLSSNSSKGSLIYLWINDE